MSPDTQHARIWNLIETSDLKALGNDKSIPMVSLNLGDDTTTLYFESEEGEEYTYEFDNNCNVKTSGNMIILTTVDAVEVDIACFDYVKVNCEA